MAMGYHVCLRNESARQDVLNMVRITILEPTFYFTLALILAVYELLSLISNESVLEDNRAPLASFL